MIKNIFALLFAVLSFQSSKCQVIQFGKCSNVETMKYFDIERFLGQWYEIERFPAWYEESGHCAYKKIQACGRKIEIEHSFVRDGIQYILHINTTYNPGDDAVFVIQQNNIDPIGIPLSVISTDYENYAVVYGCKYSEYQGLKYTWILGRDRKLQTDTLQKARLELNALPSASISYLETVNQGDDDCLHYWTAHVQYSEEEND